jgi:hypothetical protein
MEKWYNKIIEKLNKYQDEIIFVIDNNELLDNDFLVNKLSKSFDELYYYKTELKLRKKIKNNDTSLLVIVESDKNLSSYFLDNFRIVTISIDDIFPLLNKRALDWISDSEIRDIYNHYQNNFKRYEKYVLKNTYSFSLPIDNLESLVSFLMKYYFNHQKLKGAIRKIVIEDGKKLNVDINTITNQKSFFSWLEDQWYKYIIDQSSKLNFDDKKIQYVLDNCFEEGYMEKLDLIGENIDIDYVKSKIKNNFSFNSGIINFDKLSVKEFFVKEYDLLKTLLDQEINNFTWGNIARKWSHLVYLNENNKLNNDLSGLAEQVDNKFLDFILNDYDDLVYDQRFQYAPLNNKILPNLLKNCQKTALICLDGMSYKDWFVVKSYLASNLDLKYHEHFSYAIIPTITSYSRRAIFSTKTPLEDDGRFDEEKLFKSNIMNKEKLKNQKIFFDRTNEPKVFELLGYKYIGLIYNFIDEIAHQATSERLKFNNLNNFLDDSQFSVLISNLLDKNFKVYLCSDHGNLYCKGNGFNPSRDLIEKRASRSVLYRSRELAENKEFINKLVLNFPNIIGEKYILTMKNRRKFGNSEAGFTHGGVNIEEVIIPFIEVI